MKQRKCDDALDDGFGTGSGAETGTKTPDVEAVVEANGSVSRNEPISEPDSKKEVTPNAPSLDARENPDSSPKNVSASPNDPGDDEKGSKRYPGPSR